MSNKIFYPSNTEGLDEIAESLLNEETATAGNSAIEDKVEFWTLPDVFYSGIHQVGLAKTLLPAKTQDEHANHRMQIIMNGAGGFYAPSYPEFYAIVSHLEKNKDNPQNQQQIEEIKQFIKKSALENWLATLTRVRYNPQGQKDKVIHNYKQHNQYELDVDPFVGPDGFILDQSTANTEKPLQALLNTRQSLQEVNQAYKWLTDVDTYIWRVNSTPRKIDERVAGFYADSDRAGLNCNGFPGGSGSSRGEFASLGVKIL